MNELSGKTILLGVTGGVAAYKAAELARLLVKAGASVDVVLTGPLHRRRRVRRADRPRDVSVRAHGHTPR